MKLNRPADNLRGKTGYPGAKVLLVINETSSLARHSNLLREQGHEVLACDSFERGMELLGHESFDLVAVSQGNASFEGRELVTRALEKDRRIPVLVLTRLPDMKSYLEAMQLGAVDYLEMPLTPAELVRVLRTHLRYPSAA